MNNVIKGLLAVLLFIYMLEMPYGYYELARFATLIGFSIISFYAFENGNKTGAIVYTCLALLFQPFIKVALRHDLWNTTDVLVGVGLTASMFWKRTYKK